MSVAVAGAVLVGTPDAAAAPTCSPWTVSTVAQGFGMLENLAFGEDGTIFLSETSPLGMGRIQALTPDGRRRTAVPDVTSPGGLVVDGDTLFFTTGNGTAAGVFGTADGTIDTLDIETGARTTYARGLVMPNGLAMSSNGDLFTTRNLGSDTGLTVVPHEVPHEPSSVRTDIGTANGIAIDGNTVYVANTFDPALAITEVDTDDPSGQSRTLAVDGFGPLTASDDLTVGPDGQLYLAQNLASRVLRIDPRTGQSCVLGTGLPLTSSVDFGGPGWDRTSLYATSFDGTVRKLTPA
ncbi:SMP-30/gluconolactonase/LRE family protein [Rhodococcus sp. G-MC3]|uniref:SMP-30/gluconolactonase/LRE family protein n=1 Tax=Rhodococcus sp. G-MC3 TaxID=3046209 RepID=UPI0024B8CC8C|nr:SMP-30/gluconolactonase/LRE family protein [Rhodococcus sp. G-MC3]MDJ0391943.1 SMP-30/gluconolactonase/LRE family protein [Rhodococcus sp. G-MC3]